MSGQGQDAKFFQRGKIQVRRLKRRTSLRALTKRAGVPPRTPDGRDERQEVYQEENYIEEDSCEHYYGK